MDTKFSIKRLVKGGWENYLPHKGVLIFTCTGNFLMARFAIGN